MKLPVSKKLRAPSLFVLFIDGVLSLKISYASQSVLGFDSRFVGPWTFPKFPVQLF